ncbi:hypothetical protein E4T42_06725 [Aureobasidium subglaciale]|nr:hypothetical protein E4T42_06725 [Aureobasidium subglaciale]
MASTEITSSIKLRYRNFSLRPRGDQVYVITSIHESKTKDHWRLKPVCRTLAPNQRLLHSPISDSNSTPTKIFPLLPKSLKTSPQPASCFPTPFDMQNNAHTGKRKGLAGNRTRDHSQLA